MVTGDRAERGRPEGLGAGLRPTTGSLGDLSKLVRAVGTALTDAGVWTDDRLVVSFDGTRKRYACRGTGGRVRADRPRRTCNILKSVPTGSRFWLHRWCRRHWRRAHDEPKDQTMNDPDANLPNDCT